MMKQQFRMGRFGVFPLYFFVMISVAFIGAENAECEELKNAQTPGFSSRLPHLRYQVSPISTMKRLEKATLPPADIVFAIDNTGSMGGTIETVKRDVITIVDNIRELITDVRFGSIKFQDSGDVYITEIVTQPTTDIEAIQTGIDTMYADGGGDTPEAYVETVMQGVEEINWRPLAIKLLVVIGDAPPHDPIYGTGDSLSSYSWADAASLAVNAGVVVPMVAVGGGIGSGSVYDSYNYMANTTYGRYVESSDPTEVTNVLIELIGELSVERPTILSTTPSDGEDELPVDCVIQATFNMAMDASTINSDTVYIDAGFYCVMADVEYDNSSFTMSITPYWGLEPDHTYRVVLGNGITSAEGARLGTFSWIFSTITTSPQEKVLAAIDRFEESAYSAVDTQRDRVATLVSSASRRLDIDEGAMLARDAFELALSWHSSGIISAAHFGHARGMSKELAIRLSKVRAFTSSDAWKYGYKYAYKAYTHWYKLSEVLDRSDSFDSVQGHLESDYLVLDCQEDSTDSTECSIASYGARGVRAAILMNVNYLRDSIPETLSEEKATPIVNFLEEQRNMLVKSKFQEVLPNWCDDSGICVIDHKKPLGHLILHEQELEGAFNYLFAEETGKVVTTITKVTGLVLKAGGFGAFWTGVGAPVGGAGFALGQKLFWGATIADIAWTGATAFDVVLSPRDCIHNVILESYDSFNDELLLILEYVENTVNEVTRIESAKHVYAEEKLLKEEVFHGIEVNGVMVSDVILDSDEEGMAQINITNIGSNTLFAVAGGMLYGPRVAGDERALVGVVSSIEPVEITSGENVNINVSYPAIPLIHTGLDGCMLVLELSVTDMVTGERWVEGPYSAEFFGLTEAEIVMREDLDIEEIMNGNVLPGDRQEIQVYIDSGLQSVMFSLATIEGTDADLHLFNAEGNHTGYDYGIGEIVNNILGSEYSGSTSKIEIITLNLPEEGLYTLRVVGQEGNAVFSVSQIVVPDLDAMLSTSPLVVFSGNPGGTSDVLISAKEIGGSAGITGIDITLGDLLGEGENIIPSSAFSIGDYTHVLNPGESIVIPLLLNIPEEALFGDYKGVLLIDSSSGVREVLLELSVVKEIDAEEGGRPVYIYSEGEADEAEDESNGEPKEGESAVDEGETQVNEGEAQVDEGEVQTDEGEAEDAEGESDDKPDKERRIIFCGSTGQSSFYGGDLLLIVILLTLLSVASQLSKKQI